jgi:Membrane-bound toxin component of toxin-antitoxin system
VSSASFASIELEFTPPWTLLGLLFAWLTGLVAAIAHLEWPTAVRVLLGFTALPLGGWGIWMLATGLARKAVQRATWLADGTWRLVDRAGHAWHARLTRAARCWSSLAILVWDDGVTRRTAIVTRDSVGEVPFRRLRVRMRFNLPSETSSGPRM